MGITIGSGQFSTIDVRLQDTVCYIQIDRPDANNTINEQLVQEMRAALDACPDSVNVVVLEGSPEVFCFGADFRGMQQSLARGNHQEQDPEPLYDLWLTLATGPWVTVAHVRGKTNAGGVGFVAACDIVLAESAAVFSLSELLFGLMPACVLPFLVRRMGFAKANYMTLMTQPIAARQAMEWGLVDVCEDNSTGLLRRHLLRLRRLNKAGVARYKRFVNDLPNDVGTAKTAALEGNRQVFSDPQNLRLIARYVETGKFPWDPD